MGVPVPDVIKKGIDILQRKEILLKRVIDLSKHNVITSWAEWKAFLDMDITELIPEDIRAGKISGPKI